MSRTIPGSEGIVDDLCEAVEQDAAMFLGPDHLKNMLDELERLWAIEKAAWKVDRQKTLHDEHFCGQQGNAFVCQCARSHLAAALGPDPEWLAKQEAGWEQDPALMFFVNHGLRLAVSKNELVSGDLFFGETISEIEKEAEGDRAYKPHRQLYERHYGGSK